MSETERLTDAEQSYFDSRGETELPDILEEPEQQDEIDTTDTTGVEEPQDAAEQPEGDAQEQQDGEEGEQPEKVKTVPHGALHAEREEHKKTKTELQELRGDYHNLEGRVQLILQAMQGQGETAQEEPQGPPDPEEDFIGFTLYQAQQMEKLKAEREAERLQQVEFQRQQQAEYELHSAVGRAHDEFIKEVPDAPDAINFLAELRDKQLSALASIDPRFSNPDTRAQAINQEAQGIIIAAINSGKNPVGALYEIAKTYGYSGTTSKEAPAIDGGKIQAVAGAQTAAKTLTASPGASVGGAATIEDLANMSEEDFAKWYEGNKPKFRKMLGG